MSEKSINFNYKTINKSSFYRNERLFKMDDIDADKILVSKKNLMIKNSFKYIVGYDDYDYFDTLCIKLPQMAR